MSASPAPKVGRRSSSVRRYTTPELESSVKSPAAAEDKVTAPAPVYELAAAIDTPASEVTSDPAL